VKKCYAIFALFIFILTPSAFAAKVSVVKKNKMLVMLEGDSVSVGSEFFVLNSQGKKVALIKITQVKGHRAVADITKGTAQVGYSLQARGGGSGTAASSSSSSSASENYYNKKLSQKVHNGNSWGVVGGYLMNTMQVGTSSIATSMTGTGFGALGFYDYALSPSITLRAMGGMETYGVAGSNSSASPGSSCTTNCDLKISYLSLYGYGRWNFLQGNYRSWLGIGSGYLYPMSTPTSSVFTSGQLGANQIFVFSAGTDIRMNAKNYIPISLEYGLFPSTATVKANIIYLRAGFAWNL
jgi:hypothetical protein